MLQTKDECGVGDDGMAVWRYGGDPQTEGWQRIAEAGGFWWQLLGLVAVLGLVAKRRVIPRQSRSAAFAGVGEAAAYRKTKPSS